MKNHKFVSIPHAKWVEQLIYQAAWVGLTVVVTEDSSTSKAELLILDIIPVYGTQAAKKAKFGGVLKQSLMFLVLAKH